MTAVRIRQKQQEQQRQQRQGKKKKLPLRLTRGEKLLVASFFLFVVYSSVMIISNQVTIDELGRQTQRLQASIEEQERVNLDLYVQVRELSTYERILAKAKELGLTLNENNVKVVQE